MSLFHEELRLVFTKHLLKPSPLLRIQNLDNAAVPVCQHIVVVVGKIVEYGSELYRLFVSESEFLFPLGNRHGKMGDWWRGSVRCGMQAGVATETHSHRAYRHSAEEHQDERNNRHPFSRTGQADRRHIRRHRYLFPVSRQGHQHPVPIGDGRMAETGIVLRHDGCGILASSQIAGECGFAADEITAEPGQ
jgi:hypothetical protein